MASIVVNKGSKLYGAGLFNERKVLKSIGYPISKLCKKKLKVSNLVGERIELGFEELLTGENLKQYEFDHHLKIIRVKTHRSFRFSTRLPCNGQRTRTNASTCKGGIKELRVLKSTKNIDSDIFNFKLFYFFNKNKK